MRAFTEQRTTQKNVQAQYFEGPAGIPAGLTWTTVSTPTAKVGRNQETSGGRIQILASQIPEFASREEDDVNSWVRRVDKVAQVHNASDGAILLAASNRLMKSARRCFDYQQEEIVESWASLRAKILKIFDLKIPFYKLMQKKIERKWLAHKETFDEYAIEKLAWMNRNDLLESNKIQLLISSITITPLKATALSVSAESLDISDENATYYAGRHKLG